MFYKMEADRKYKDLWLNDRVGHFRSIICPKYPEHQRATRSACNLSLELKSDKIGDFATTVYSDWLVSDKIACALKESGLTGYELRLADICNNSLGYSLWELVVTGKGGEAHLDAGIVKIYQCDYCDHMQYHAFANGVGIVVDENNWDGSDFFTITAYPKYVLVTPKVKTIVEEGKWTGVCFVPSTELHRDERLGNAVSPL